jgi:hypothetical protein
VPRPRLARASADFAAGLTRLLNSTVADGASVWCVSSGDTMVIDCGDRTSDRPIRLRTAPGAHLWLDVKATLFADEAGYLTVGKSTWALSGGRNAESTFLHYDYERGKEGYAEAHLQVVNRVPELEEYLSAVGRRKSRMQHLHLPVGGRRFRPALEDLIEFLIDERMVEAKPDSRPILERSRAAYQDIQLLAAIRRRPGKAAEGLLDLGYTLEEPAASRVG